MLPAKPAPPAYFVYITASNSKMCYGVVLIVLPCEPKTAPPLKETSLALKPDCARTGVPSDKQCAGLVPLGPGAQPKTSVQIATAGSILNRKLEAEAFCIIKTSN